VSSHLDLDDLNFARDIPTTRDDLEYLGRSIPIGENLLPRLDRLTQAVRSLGIRPGRETAEGWAPFELHDAT
jgi:hypothetical protein